MNNIEYIRSRITAPESGIRNTVKLLSEDCTVPFIARYRKDMTGNLDEVAIAAIAQFEKEFAAISKRKEAILKAISAQEQLTPELQKKIESTFDLTELEDLYLPFKKKKNSRADVARENGLEPLARIIMAQRSEELGFIASKYINPKVINEDEALQGARDIIAEWISENAYLRRQLRFLFRRKATISSKVVKSKTDQEQAQKFTQYFEWSENLQRTPPHRLLAMLRAENEGFVKIKLEVDKDEAIELISQSVIKAPNPESKAQLDLAIADSYKRLLLPAISNEVLQEAKDRADVASIKVFAANLSQLLMSPPLGEKRIMGIDPGFRSGCKIVCLDEKGDLLHNETIYPHPPQNEAALAMKKIRSLANAYKVDAIAIGNGTASRETETFIKKIAFDKPLQVFVVSEAGASVYSASAVAREEFRNYDVTVRGAVSIGRRLSDPLAELVKIDPKAIGVGQYQHDVDQVKLREELDSVVMRCVNSVGININTASKHLLSYVSGIGEKMAENIVKFRSENGAFVSRQQLKKVPRLGEKAFQQSAAFIRISKPENPLDNSAVHPEAYPIVEKMAKDLAVSLSDLIGNKELVKKVDPTKYATTEIGVLTLNDIFKELEKPGLDPRKAAAVFEFDPSVKSINDLRTGMILSGIVNNITNFGCFVDIGIKESGLIHISQLSAGFVSDVNSVVKLHQHIKVKVLEVDEQRRRIQLSLEK
ncbi:MAG: RNA-binding transcriptional accessory protein [Flavobacterium sp.]|nr:MAG: RNA-binding transcriptional accessory protein [Flavobacterium sp.]